MLDDTLDFEEDKELSTADLKRYMWRQGELGWKLDTLQETITEIVTFAAAKKICILSSRQIGKSFWAVIFALEFLIKFPGKIARIIAPTLTACNDIVNDNLTRIMEDAPKGLILRRRSEMRWEVHHGNGVVSSLRLGALEREHVDKNRGGNASLVIYEECGFVHGDDFIYGVDSVIGPQLLRSKGVELFVSTPSEDPEHPLHTKVKPKCEALGTFFAYTVYDSPSITPEMIEEAIERCGGIDTDAFQREYLARIIRPSSFIVIPSFNERRHVVAYPPPTACNWTVTIDWGGVKDLTVALMHGYDFIGGKDIIWDEKVFAANTSTDVIAMELKEWETTWGFKVQARYADVFSQTGIDLHSLGYNTQVPLKGTWLSTVNGMAVKFSMDRVLVHPRCAFLRRSLTGGMFNKHRTDYERSSELGHCDALAALGYAFNVQLRTNPYTMEAEMPENVFVVTKPKDEDKEFAEALNPKQWGAQRKFGGFRK